MSGRSRLRLPSSRDPDRTPGPRRGVAADHLLARRAQLNRRCIAPARNPGLAARARGSRDAVTARSVADVDPAVTGEPAPAAAVDDDAAATEATPAVTVSLATAPSAAATAALGERAAACGNRRSRERKGCNRDGEDLLGLRGHEFLLPSCWDQATAARSVIRTCGEAQIDDVTVVTGMRFSSGRHPACAGACPGILPFPRPGLTPSYRTEPLADSAMGRANGKT